MRRAVNRRPTSGDRVSGPFARAAAWLAAVLLITVDTAALAGAISVSPIRLELTPRHPVATVEVRNEGDDFVTVQIEKLDWTQGDGSDSYSPSAALLATPGVFDLPPHGSQTLRVGIRDPQQGGAERAFRLYAAEVPSADPDEGAGLHMALRIGIPVFVQPTPGTARLVSELRELPDGKLALHVRNTGSRFTRALSIDLQTAAGKLLWHDSLPTYLLAGGEHLWVIDSIDAKPSGSVHLQLSILTEDGRDRIDTPFGP